MTQQIFLIHYIFLVSTFMEISEKPTEPKFAYDIRQKIIRFQSNNNNIDIER